MAPGGEDDLNHARSRDTWRGLSATRSRLVTSNDVVVGTLALLQRRAGLDAARAFAEELLPVLSVVWVMPQDHGAGVAAVFRTGRRNLSLVDCTSFEVMLRLGLDMAFSFDPHFAEMGFAVIPDSG